MSDKETYPRLLEAFFDLIRQEDIHTYFQPIMSIDSGKAIAYEALSRGPKHSQLHEPDRLFQLAGKLSANIELEQICMKKACENFAKLDIKEKLFINLSYDGLLNSSRFSENLTALLSSAGLSADQITIEITERSSTPDVTLLINACQLFHNMGFSIAIDDLGAGYSTLRLWSEIKPDYVKLDRHFISGIDTDIIKFEFVRSIIEISRSMDCSVIAEGIETEGEAESLVSMGIRLMQGYYFQKPSEYPDTSVEVDISIRRPPTPCYHAENLISFRNAISPNESVAAVSRLLQENTSISSLAIVEDGKPLGLVHRHTLLAVLSRPFALDLYARKPISTLMEQDILVVDAKLRLEQVSRMVTHRARIHKEDDFIITTHGRFLGIGQVIDILRQITEIQVKSARHANPLTMLPGNVPIGDKVNELLCEKSPFTIIYFDLDHFKPFNDIYGYARGDEILVWFAGVLQQFCASDTNFIGHIGGDDFIVVLTENLEEQQEGIIHPLLKAFTEGVKHFYDENHLKTGGITTEDRFGENRFFQMMTVSGAALCVQRMQTEFMNFRELSTRLSQIKKEAKAIKESAVIYGNKNCQCVGHDCSPSEKNQPILISFPG